MPGAIRSGSARPRPGSSRMPVKHDSFSKSADWSELAKPYLSGVPVAVVALAVLLLHRRPGDLVRGFLARFIAASIGLVGVFAPRMVERFLVDFLCMFR